MNACIRFSIPLLLSSLLLRPVNVAFSQVEPHLPPVFESAAKEWNVPSPILQGIAFVESRWAQVRPLEYQDGERHIPPAYGVMGLRDDSWFGHSLVRAAALLGEKPSVLMRDPVANIRGAAAVLAEIAQQQQLRPSVSDLESWLNVVAQYSGIPQPNVQAVYVRDVYRVLGEGYRDMGIVIERQQFNGERLESTLQSGYDESLAMSPMSPDYPPAEWVPSPNFNSRGGSAITHVIIHDTEGNYAGSLSWLITPASQVSSHYLLRSSDGHIAQLVHESDRAWHVGCWNSWTIGLEHEGYVAQPQFFTAQMYLASALLVRDICNRYSIPKDRLHIVGHNVWQSTVLFPQLGWDNCNTHTDPGIWWNWEGYIAQVVGDSTPPQIVSHFPADGAVGVPIYKKISVSFDRTMDIFSVQSAFSISPSTAGSFKWSADGKTMMFSPATVLQPATAFHVVFNGTVNGAGGGTLTTPLALDFTTAPVDSDGPSVYSAFPRAGMESVSPWMGFQMKFDEPVVYSSFAGHVRLVDLADSAVSLAVGGISYTDTDDGGLLTFAPNAQLQFGHRYRLSFLPGLKDPLGNTTISETRIEFGTQSSPDPQGTVIDPFEDNSGQWQEPWVSAGSSGLDSAVTSFSISSTKKKTGTFSGRLSYGFAGTAGGICRLRTTSEINVQNAGSWVGLWVFGDNSNNQLGFWFSTNSGDALAIVDTINWYGWKFESLPLARLQGGSLSLNSVGVLQNSGGDPNGLVYLDDMEADIATGVSLRGPRQPYKSFALLQNYPNPFNPSTTISFELDRPEHATLTVYNTLGQRVAVVLDGAIEAGRHSIRFDGRNDDGKALPSGVYFYRLQTSSGADQKKMLLVR